MVILRFEQNEIRWSKNREYLIGILETLLEILGDGVEWETIPDNVLRAVMGMAIAVAKGGPDPPGFDRGDEDSQIDPFLAMIAAKSDSPLLGTPTSDNPRYWGFWLERGGFDSASS